MRNFFAVPPKIDPFNFPTNIQEGVRVHVTCAVSQGDAPVKIQWLKDGRPLKVGEATTHQIDAFDLSLKIERALKAHEGNYTCVASNDAATISHTAPLLVHGTDTRQHPFTIFSHSLIVIASFFYLARALPNFRLSKFTRLFFHLVLSDVTYLASLSLF